MENEIVKKEVQQSFIERLVEKASGLNEIKQVGEVIIASGFCPDHFRQSKDAVGVIMCIEAGRALGMSWMQALSDLYPVKGRIGMMGDAAVALIMGSGVLEYWHESTEGTYPNLDYKHIIVSKRKGFPSENTSEFSVFDAKTAGLMDKDIYKKYGKRMLRYRNAGFHARDYFADILKGMKTVEELEDYDIVKPSGETKLTTSSGKEISIDPNKAVKAEAISNNVTKLIDKANGVHKEEPIQEAEVVTDNPPTDEKSGPKVWTLEELTDMKEDIYEKIKGILPPAKVTLLESLKGRRSNRLYRDAVIYYQNGQLDNWLLGESMRREKAEKEADKGNGSPETKVSPPIEANEPVDGSDIDKLFEQKQNGITSAQARESFEAQKMGQHQELTPEEKGNDGFVIPPLKEGKRAFSDMVKLNRYLLDNGIPKVSFTESFISTATEEQILALIQNK